MHFSPQVALLEATCSALLFIYFLWHCWRYDRWSCFKVWRLAKESPSDPWKLKRILTVFYLVRLPLIFVRAIMILRIKYEAGFTDVHGAGRGMPVPYTMWNSRDRHWINPLNCLDAVIWWADLCTALEELCFWFFLIFRGPKADRWFSSPFFKAFAFGSFVYGIVFATLTAGYLENPIHVEAVTFMAFSSGVLLQCICFCYVLYAFPQIINKLAHHGGSPDLLHRLLSFHELNKIQLFLRMMFGLSLATVSLDGLGAFNKIASRANPLNTDLAALDFLLFWSILCNCGAALVTIHVFLPRSPLEEHHIRDRRVANPYGGAIFMPSRRDSSVTIIGEDAFQWEYDSRAEKRASSTIETLSKQVTIPDDLPQPPLPVHQLETMPTNASSAQESLSCDAPSGRSSMVSNYAPSLPDLPPMGSLSRVSWFLPHYGQVPRPSSCDIEAIPDEKASQWATSQMDEYRADVIRLAGLPPSPTSSTATAVSFADQQKSTEAPDAKKTQFIETQTSSMEELRPYQQYQLGPLSPLVEGEETDMEDDTHRMTEVPLESPVTHKGTSDLEARSRRRRTTWLGGVVMAPAGSE